MIERHHELVPLSETERHHIFFMLKKEFDSIDPEHDRGNQRKFLMSLMARIYPHLYQYHKIDQELTFDDVRMR